MSSMGVDTGEIASAATSIRAAAQAIGELNNDLASANVTAADFGRAHGAAAQAYFDGIRKLVQAVDAKAKAVDEYADNLNSAARGYEDSDSSAADTLARSGSAG